MFAEAGLRAIRVSITAGTGVTKQDALRWSVAKTELISGVDARLHSGELRFAAELTEAPALAEEFKDFRRHLTAAGHATYQARTGKHDDLVLAVSLCVWWATERRKLSHPRRPPSRTLLMPTLSPGALCTCPRASGTQLRVVVGRADDGRWRLRSKRVDWRGWSDVACRVASAGDLVLIRPAPTYSPGTMIEH